MSDTESDEASVPRQLWSVVQNLQAIRQQDEIDRRDGRKLKSAIAEVDSVRKSVQSQQTEDSDAE